MTGLGRTLGYPSINHEDADALSVKYKPKTLTINDNDNNTQQRHLLGTVRNNCLKVGV